MKRLVIREVETLKATSAMYACDCCCPYVVCYTDAGDILCC